MNGQMIVAPFQMAGSDGQMAGAARQAGLWALGHAPDFLARFIKRQIDGAEIFGITLTIAPGACVIG